MPQSLNTCSKKAKLCCKKVHLNVIFWSCFLHSFLHKVYKTWHIDSKRTTVDMFNTRYKTFCLLKLENVVFRCGWKYVIEKQPYAWVDLLCFVDFAVFDVEAAIEN